MQAHANYIPILRAKMGEIDALGHLSERAKFRTMPVLDVPEPNEEGRASVTEHFAWISDSLARSWGTVYPVYLDLARYPVTTPSIEDVVIALFSSTRQTNLKALPVAGPLSFRGNAYLDAVSSVAREDGRGMALRLPHEDFEDPTTLTTTLDQCLAELALPATLIDLLFDFEAIDRLPDVDTAITIVNILSTAVQAATPYGFRRLVLCGSSIPDSGSARKGLPYLEIERKEFAAWKRLTTDRPRLSLTFGDYAVIPPFQTKPTKAVRVPARVRFATSDKQIFLRAPRKDYRSLAQKATKTREFQELPPSWGSNCVKECAANYGTSSGPTQWVARDTNMHIEATVAHVERHLQKIAPELLGPAVELPRSAWLQDALPFAVTPDASSDSTHRE